MTRRYQYRTVTARSVLPGDQIKSADGRTWLPPVTQQEPDSRISGIVSIWWGVPASERQADWQTLCTAEVSIRRPSRS